MSLFFLGRLINSKNKLSVRQNEHLDEAQMVLLRRYQGWLLTYIALFTSLLAFLILVISLVEIEGSTPKRHYQLFVKELYQAVEREKQQQGLEWLQVENTLTKGIKITLPADLIRNNSLFVSARAQLNPRYIPYLQSLAELFLRLDLVAFEKQHQALIQSIAPNPENFSILLSIAGHTDSEPLAPTARYPNNVALSTYRAFAMMRWLQENTGLPAQRFAIAGYGSYQPLSQQASNAENRRIEIFLRPHVQKNRIESL